jgi:hypothetical protein
MPYIDRYLLCALLAYLGQDWVTSEYPPFAAAGALLLAAAAALLAGMAWPWIRCQRDSTVALRRQLVQLIAERAGMEATWLNRDEHLAFATIVDRRPVRRWALLRIDEDQAREVKEAEDLAVVPITGEVFSVKAGEPRVGRKFEGALARVEEDRSLTHQPQPPAAWNSRAWWQAHRAGDLHASPDELREVIRQFEAAEQLTRGSDDG